MIARNAAFIWALILFKIPDDARACDGTYIAQGLITTNNFYASNYPWGSLPFNDNRLAQCRWTLIPAPGKLVSLFFNVFDLAPGARLSIYRGTNATTGAMPIVEYSGKGPSGGVVQVADGIQLVFNDVDLSFTRGFQVVFYSKKPATLRSNVGLPSPVCGGTLVGAGTVVSPGHRGWYPLNSRCLWTLSSCEAGAQLTVRFTAMDLEQGFDTVTLTSGQIQYGPYSGSSLPKDITANSPIIVAFSSDNVMSYNMGFSLQFSTVSVAASPLDPLANPNSCGVLCPTTTRSDPSYFCYVHDVMHMRRFGGYIYTFPFDGLFYLYKHRTSPVVVQAAFQACQAAAGANCVCAVAVRYCDEVFVVDRCAYKSHPGSRSNKLYKAGSTSAMLITPRNVGGWTVSLPSGLTVEVGATREWIGTVDIHDSLVNQNASEGLCSATYRCGTSPSQNMTSDESWRVPADESLFIIWKQPAPCKISKCANCSKLPVQPLPTGILNLSDPNISADQYSDSSNFLFNTTATIRGKRFAQDQWTLNQAFYTCYNSMQWTQEMNACTQLIGRVINLEEDIVNCMRDIKLTGTTTYVITAKEASKATCLRELSKAGINASSVISLMCPNDCSGKGTCIKGVCSCFANRYGRDCSISIDAPPVVTHSSAPVNCTTNATVVGTCLLQYVYGQTFYAVKPGFPRCKVTYQLVVPGTESAANVTVADQPATYLSPSVVACLLPPGAPGQRIRYAVSITNDGTSYSSNVTTERFFEIACLRTFYGSGTLLSPNYPSSYDNNARCVWVLVAPQNMSVRLSFNAFNLENTFDILKCEDGGFLIDSFTGVFVGDLPTRTYGSSLTCTFTSDSTTTKLGFNITFTSVGLAARCGGSITDSGNITSPGYPSSYPSNAYCLWTLTATAGKNLHLHLSDLTLESGYDFLYIYAGGVLVASLTGQPKLVDYVMPSTAHVVFRSDGSTELQGFSAFVTSNSVPYFD